MPRINASLDKDENEAKTYFRVGVVSLQARLATYPNLHCTYLSLSPYMGKKSVERQTDKQTAISSKPYDRPCNCTSCVSFACSTCTPTIYV